MLIKSHFENDDFIIVEKPEGVSFHNESDSLGFFSLVKQQFQLDLWPVHRLDKVTSGLVIVSKSQKVAKDLSYLFQSKLINKTYLALSDRKPKKKQGLIKGDMQASRRGAFKLLRTNDNPAITSFFSNSLRPGIRLYKLFPQTGKTHQLRVAMKSLGAPILGDLLYSGTEAKRVYLHAYQLSFSYKGKNFEFESIPSWEDYSELSSIL